MDHVIWEADYPNFRFPGNIGSVSFEFFEIRKCRYVDFARFAVIHHLLHFHNSFLEKQGHVR